MSAFFISIAIIVIALIAAICFMVAELFWPIMAILVVFFLWKLVSQRKGGGNNYSDNSSTPFEEEKD